MQGQIATAFNNVMVRDAFDKPFVLRYLRRDGKIGIISDEKKSHTVGFPLDRIYEPDAELLARIEDAHSADDAALVRQLWANAATFCTTPVTSRG